MISGKWQIGDRIGNRYEIHQIAVGGMGIVYICYDHKYGSPKVLKTFQDKYLWSEQAQKLFEQEALVWTELERYPYIVRADFVDRLEGRLFILLEYIAPDQEGRNSLSHYLDDLSLPDALKFSIQCCYGMEYAYSKGIDAHRDIKPENILITANQTAKITDFGLAKAFQEIRFKIQELASSAEFVQGHRLSIFKSKAKQVCGTLPYMAPEQFDGYADKRSDIYSFGIVLYQMVTNGSLPFVGKTGEEYERWHKKGKIASISSPLYPIIIKCLEKKPGKRFQDFGLMREELQEILLEETGESIIPPNVEELAAWELSNKGLALGNLGRYAEAIRCYDEALQRNPRLAETWCNKGISLYNLGKCAEAIKCFSEALVLDPTDAAAWSNKAIVLRKLGQSEEAIRCYDEALKLNPRYAAAWSNKGNALGDLGLYEEEIRCHDEALNINPRLVEAWYNKGVAFGRLDMYDEAIRCYDEALRIYPGDAAPWYNKGFMLYLLHRYSAALECVEEAMRLSPNDSKMHKLKDTIIAELEK